MNSWTSQKMCVQDYMNLLEFLILLGHLRE